VSVWTATATVTPTPTAATAAKISKSVVLPTVVAGGEVTYAIYIQARSSSSETVTQVVDALPSGFTYVPGSTTVSIDGGTPILGSSSAACEPSGTTTLTWTWPTSGAKCDGHTITIPAGQGLVLTFRLTAGAAAGTYTNGTLSLVGTPVVAIPTATPGGAPVAVVTGAPAWCTNDQTTQVSSLANGTGRYVVVTTDQATSLEAFWEIGTTNDKKVRVIVYAGTPSFVTPGSTSGTASGGPPGTTLSGGDSGQKLTTSLLWRVNGLAAGTYTVLFRAEENGVKTDAATVSYSKSVCP
jgi:uncharacterized repeat protein (TIGR01451 family)